MAAAKVRHPAQAFQSSYAPRLRSYANSLTVPILVTQAIPPATARTTKRGTTIKNYADDVYDEDDFDDDTSDSRPQRPTGLRSLQRRNEDAPSSTPKPDQANAARANRETSRPVDSQAIHRSWMLDSTRPRRPPTVQGAHAQAQLPLTLIPIRIDYEILPFQPDPPFPLPARGYESQVNILQPAFRRPESVPGYKIRDIFLWNLHETLLTPEDFAIIFCQDLDLPSQRVHEAVAEIAKQIRSQCEEYAGIALHPLFHITPATTAKQIPGGPVQQTRAIPELRKQGSRSQAGTPRPRSAAGTPLRELTSRPITPRPNTPSQLSNTTTNQPQITATAQVLEPSSQAPPPSNPDTRSEAPEIDPSLNPDDTYRCLISLSIAHNQHLYTDKFEWSLLHPPGAAESFARLTCADLGLPGEWVLSITHAILESVLELKKQTCQGTAWLETGGYVDNSAARAEEGAGWRWLGDSEGFGDEWTPRVEVLSKEDVEKREENRERQLRRQRRETARFTSTTGMAGPVVSAREQEARDRAGYFEFSAHGLGVGAGYGSETPLNGTGMGGFGRGERNRRRRKRSPSPESSREVNGASDGGWGGEEGRLGEYERAVWRCGWCFVPGTAVWGVRDGPRGPKTLCNNCGLLYERDKELPVWSRDLHRGRRGTTAR